MNYRPLNIISHRLSIMLNHITSHSLIRNNSNSSNHSTTRHNNSTGITHPIHPLPGMRRTILTLVIHGACQTRAVTVATDKGALEHFLYLHRVPGINSTHIRLTNLTTARWVDQA
jgi:hypothetical protein